MVDIWERGFEVAGLCGQLNAALSSSLMRMYTGLDFQFHKVLLEKPQ